MGSGALSVWSSQWLHPRSPQVSCSASPVKQLRWFNGRMLTCHADGPGLILFSTQPVSQFLHNHVGSGSPSVWQSQWICLKSPHTQLVSQFLRYPVGSGTFSVWPSQWIHSRSPQVSCSATPSSLINLFLLLDLPVGSGSLPVWPSQWIHSRCP